MSASMPRFPCRTASKPTFRLNPRATPLPLWPAAALQNLLLGAVEKAGRANGPSAGLAIVNLFDTACKLYTVYKMNNTSVTRRTLADQVYDRIVDAIVVGDIKAGSPLSENEIAMRFNVSRGPAREAIFRLEAKGLATRVAHFGARVVDLSLEDLRSLFELREALEGMACRLAAERITDAELAMLENCLRSHAEQPEFAAGESYYQPGGDQDFHFGIARASHNPRLFRTLSDNIYDVMRPYRFRSSQTPGRTIEAFKEHRVVIEALSTRDPLKAEAAMRAHIRSSWLNTKNAFQTKERL